MDVRLVFKTQELIDVQEEYPSLFVFMFCICVLIRLVLIVLTTADVYELHFILCDFLCENFIIVLSILIIIIVYDDLVETKIQMMLDEFLDVLELVLCYC